MAIGLKSVRGLAAGPSSYGGQHSQKTEEKHACMTEMIKLRSQDERIPFGKNHTRRTLGG